MESGYNRRSSRSSDDESKNLSTSLTEGTSKFFTSMIAKKNGLFSDLSSKIETTFMKSGASSSASSENTSPVNSPPPRPPPPTRRPSEKCFQKRNLPPRSSSVANRGSTSGSVDDPLTVNGMNISFDEPLYNKREAPVGRSSEPTENVSYVRENTERVGPTGGNSMESQQNQRSVKPNGHLAKREHNMSSSSADSDKDKPTEKERRAPKLKAGRRSSTVDEMLFDDYVAPDDIDVNSNEPIFGDLMSFDQSEQHSPDVKTSPYPSQSSVDSNASSNRLYTTTSVDSSDAEYGGVPVHRSGSQGSDKSWSSNYSIDSQPDEVTLECMEFMKLFVDKVFNTSDDVSQTEKAKFGELCQYSPGRLWFARYVNGQRVHSKKVDEPIFFRLVQYFAVCLFECNEAEDYSPAKTLMNMCFTFYLQDQNPGGGTYKHFLYSYLRDQPVWQSLRFWNAAFFDAIQGERSRKPVPKNNEETDIRTDDRQFQENITFGQLGTFTCNMRAFGLSRELCMEFLRKQAIIANLNKEQVKMLKDNFDKYKDH
ncbi:hypothetical protein SNE40_007355 [Patella caerulea]|uniref:SBF1/SBF2 domain-containing protein n=1 Tax=Patella caerulea TaxID=87958 RepID=A0AAN8K3F5_PATCE